VQTTCYSVPCCTIQPMSYNVQADVRTQPACCSNSLIDADVMLNDIHILACKHCYSCLVLLFNVCCSVLATYSPAYSCTHSPVDSVFDVCYFFTCVLWHRTWQCWRLRCPLLTVRVMLWPADHKRIVIPAFPKQHFPQYISVAHYRCHFYCYITLIKVVLHFAILT